MSLQVNFNAHGMALRVAYESILNSSSNDDWVLFGYDKGTNDLKVLGTGSGGLEELQDEFADGKIQYAFARVVDPNSNLNKFVLIGWCGDGVPESKKGLFNNHFADVSRFLKGYHLQINARSEEDVTPQQVMKKIDEASASKYSYHKEVQKGRDLITPLQSAYKKTEIPDIAAMQRSSTKPVPAPKYGIGASSSSSSSSVASRWNPPAASPSASSTTPPVSSSSSTTTERSWRTGGSSYVPPTSSNTFNKVAPPSSLANYTVERNDPSMNKAHQIRMEREQREREERARIEQETKAREAREREADSKQAAANKMAEERRQQEERERAAEARRIQEQQARREKEEQERKEQEQAEEMEKSARAAREAAKQREQAVIEAARERARKEEEAREQAAAEAESEARKRREEEDRLRRQQEEEREKARKKVEEEERARRQAQEEEEREARRRQQEQEEKEAHRRQQEQEEEERRLQEEVQAATAQSVNLGADALIASSEHPERAAGDQTKTAVVLYSYEAAEANEMSLVEGEIIYNVSELDVGWWSGESEDGTRSGLFPANYVELIEHQHPASNGVEPTAHEQDHHPAPTTGGGAGGGTGAADAAGGGSGKPTAVALYDYTAGEPNEISFTEGETIVDVEQVTEDWWQGMNQKGDIGLFPANYVELIQ